MTVGKHKWGWLPALLLCLACGSGDRQENTPEWQATLAAKQCYEALYIQKQPEGFLYGRLHVGELPQDYRQQLLEAYRGHIRLVERQHGGVKTVDMARTALPDSTLGVMQVFLQLRFNDGKTEEVVVPMVDDGGRWRMK
jgi:hypothetical protein